MDERLLVFIAGLHKSGTVNDYPTGVNTIGDYDRLRGGTVGYDFGDIDANIHYFDSYIADNFEEYNDAFMGFSPFEPRFPSGWCFSQ